MALKIFQPTEALPTEGVVLILYGGTDTWKTTVGCSSPTALHFDFDRKGYRAARRDAVSVQIDRWEDDIPSKDVLAELLADKTIVTIDTVGRMLEAIFSSLARTRREDCTRKSGEPSQQGYGALKSIVMGFVQNLRDAKPGINIIFLVHSSEEKGSRDELVEKLYIQGGFRHESGWLADATGLMVRVEPDAEGQAAGHDVERYIDFRYRDGRSTKDNGNIGLLKMNGPNDLDYADYLIERVQEGMRKSQEENIATARRRELLTQSVKVSATPEDLTGLALTAVEEPNAIKKIITDYAKAKGWAWKEGKFQAS